MLYYQISREKSEPEPGLEPRTFEDSSASIFFHLKFDNIKFPKTQIINLFSLNNWIVALLYYIIYIIII